MNFQININMDNAAFDEDNREQEVYRLLSKIIRKINRREIDLHVGVYVLILDTNGKTVGDVSVYEGDDDA